MTTEAADRFQADFVRVLSALPGAGVPWVKHVRRLAMQRFAQMGFPTTRDEDWKYTSVAALEERAFIAWPDGADAAAAPCIDSLDLGAAGHLLVFVNGRHSAGLSAVGNLPAGVILCSLADALDRTPMLLESFLAEDRHQTVFASLNKALMSDGIYLHLPHGIAIDEPIHVLFISTAHGGATHSRNVIVAEAGAKATLIEHYSGPDGVPYFTNAVTQVYVAANASVEHCKLQQEGLQAFHIGGVHAVQGRDSRFVSHSIAIGGSLARNDITTTLDAQGCEATLNGLYIVGGRQHVDHHTRIDHTQPHGTSREYYRGVLDGASRGVFNGKVIVHPGAQRTDAHQANRNLLLSKGAQVDTKPQLEIQADDVKCTHGATVSQLDDAQIFYLRSRGIEEATARSLLTYAFAHDVIERIRLAPLRARLEQILQCRLPGGHLIRELA